jgi:uncharacterized membrane protein YccC
MSFLKNWISGIRGLHWARGIRAGLAVAVAMSVCHLLGQPIGWAALGGFEAILVDNGGPYRSRLMTMGTLMAGGAAACVLGSMAATPLALALLVTATFCFAVTFARVIAQPIASTSVIVLVIYFAGYGGATHSLHWSLIEALQFVMGGACAAVLSLILWPLDPFRPARQAVASCYEVLAGFTAGVKATAPRSEEREAERSRVHQLQRTMRLKMEEARRSLETTAARTASRTLRARSLTVLLETVDMLFAETIRWTELVESVEDEDSRVQILASLRWLSEAEFAVAKGLSERPADDAMSFAPEGSQSLDHVRGRAEKIARNVGAEGSVMAYFAADERDALQNIEIAFESIRAIWSGVDVRSGDVAKRWSMLADRGVEERRLAAGAAMGWKEILIANWTGSSVMMRHALRLAVVGAIDVLVLWVMHFSHGSWLGMTSVIVLQPYGSGTLRKSLERVGGTIAGGVLAAVLAASIRDQMGIMVVITVASVLTLATYAVNYAWYSFFLTPTFVLMSLPHLRDWHFAGVRIEMTAIGALVAVLAMRLLWPEKERVALWRLLGHGAAADAAYVQAMVRFWKVNTDQKSIAEREILAPARRRSGLAVIDAQETLDRLLLEPEIGWRNSNRSNSSWESALTFVTYLQRFTRAVTTLAVVGVPSESVLRRVDEVAGRLDALSRRLLAHETPELEYVPLAPPLLSEESNITQQQIRRMERQVGVMERAAASLLAHKA